MLSHVNEHGFAAMVDVSDKAVTKRIAQAESSLQLSNEIFAQLAMTATATGDWLSSKGPVMATAIIAGTMAAKRTADLIPFCHPLPVFGCNIHITPDAATCRIHILCEVKTEHKTGVEMEALVGASVTALTIYDMLKALGHDMVIGETRLLAKSGGRRQIT